MKFQATELVFRQELFQARVELEKKGSKLEKKDSEFQAAFQGLKVVNQLAEGDKVELCLSLVHRLLTHSNIYCD